MTAQAANKIWIDSEPWRLLSDPISPMLVRLGNPPFCARGTANWCGYTTDWAIRDGRLYLVDLQGDVCRRKPLAGATQSSWCRIPHDGPCEPETIKLRDLTDVPAEGVVATWVSEELRIARGAIIDYVHLGWGSRFKEEKILAVQEGYVTSSRLRSDLVEEQSLAPVSKWNRLRRAFRGGT